MQSSSNFFHEENEHFYIMPALEEFLNNPAFIGEDEGFDIMKDDLLNILKTNNWLK
jgi:hypothetical protein